jgi:hypothetical protein
VLRELFGSCSVHKVRLLEAEVPVRYGRVVFSRAYVRAERRFPNSQSFALGGCYILPDNPKTRAVRYCPRCRKAEADWHATEGQVHGPR